jgi:non-ribosomal peptide synthetase component F
MYRVLYKTQHAVILGPPVGILEATLVERALRHYGWDTRLLVDHPDFADRGWRRAHGWREVYGNPFAPPPIEIQVDSIPPAEAIVARERRRLEEERRQLPKAPAAREISSLGLAVLAWNCVALLAWRAFVFCTGFKPKGQACPRSS